MGSNPIPRIWTRSLMLQSSFLNRSFQKLFYDLPGRTIIYRQLFSSNQARTRRKRDQSSSPGAHHHADRYSPDPRIHRRTPVLQEHQPRSYEHAHLHVGSMAPVYRACYKPDPNGERLVFVNERGKPLIHATINKRLKCIAKDARICKYITPHVFRHSKITHLIRRRSRRA